MNAVIISRACRAVDDDQLTAPTVTFLQSSEMEQSESWVSRLGDKFSGQGYDVSWSSLDGLPLDRENMTVVSLLDVSGPFFSDCYSDRLKKFQAFITSSPPKKTLWITKRAQLGCEQPEYGLSIGMARTIRTELGLDFRTLEVDAFDETAIDAVWEVHRRQNQTAETEVFDSEYALHDGVIHIARFETNAIQSYHPKPSQYPHLRLDLEAPGLLGSLRWIQIEDNPPEIPADHVEIEMHYVGLNFKDLMQAMGVLESSICLGLEGSGIVRRAGSQVTEVTVGDRVAVLCQGTFHNKLLCPANNCLRIPSILSLEQAAAVPCVYATAIWSLVHVARLRKGQVSFAICLLSISIFSTPVLHLAHSRYYLYLVANILAHCTECFDTFRLWRRWFGLSQYLSENRRRCQLPPHILSIFRSFCNG